MDPPPHDSNEWRLRQPSPDEMNLLVQQEMSNLKALKRLSLGIAVGPAQDPDLPDLDTGEPRDGSDSSAGLTGLCYDVSGPGSSPGAGASVHISASGRSRVSISRTRSGRIQRQSSLSNCNNEPLDGEEISPKSSPASSIYGDQSIPSYGDNAAPRFARHASITKQASVRRESSAPLIRSHGERDRTFNLTDHNPSDIQNMWVPAGLHPELAPNEWQAFVQEKLTEIRNSQEAQQQSKNAKHLSRLSHIVVDPEEYIDASDLLDSRRRSSNDDRRRSILELSKDFVNESRETSEQSDFALHPAVTPELQLGATSLRRSTHRLRKPTTQSPHQWQTKPHLELAHQAYQQPQKHQPQQQQSQQHYLAQDCHTQQLTDQPRGHTEPPQVPTHGNRNVYSGRHKKNESIDFTTTPTRYESRSPSKLEQAARLRAPLSISVSAAKAVAHTVEQPPSPSAATPSPNASVMLGYRRRKKQDDQPLSPAESRIESRIDTSVSECVAEPFPDHLQSTGPTSHPAAHLPAHQSIHTPAHPASHTPAYPASHTTPSHAPSYASRASDHVHASSHAPGRTTGHTGHARKPSMEENYAKVGACAVAAHAGSHSGDTTSTHGPAHGTSPTDMTSSPRVTHPPEPRTNTSPKGHARRSTSDLGSVERVPADSPMRQHVDRDSEEFEPAAEKCNVPGENKKSDRRWRWLDSSSSSSITSSNTSVKERDTKEEAPKETRKTFANLFKKSKSTKKEEPVSKSDFEPSLASSPVLHEVQSSHSVPTSTTSKTSRVPGRGEHTPPERGTPMPSNAKSSTPIPGTPVARKSVGGPIPGTHMPGGSGTPISDSYPHHQDHTRRRGHARADSRLSNETEFVDDLQEMPAEEEPKAENFSRVTATPDIKLPYDIPAHQMSDRSFVMMYHRFPLHIERAIYRLSHMKLANPRRPLMQQVLLSNFMYAYLNLINYGYQQQQLAALEEQRNVQRGMGGANGGGASAARRMDGNLGGNMGGMGGHLEASQIEQLRRIESKNYEDSMYAHAGGAEEDDSSSSSDEEEGESETPHKRMHLSQDRSSPSIY